MSWPKHTFRGVEYTFDHLRRFRITAGGLCVLVKFGAHVFCKEFDPSDPPDLKFMDGKTERTFCPIRYGLSLSLGPTIVAASSQYVYESGRGRFHFKQALPAHQGTYVIGFDMRPCNAPGAHVTLQLTTAHVRQYVKKGRFALFADAVAAVANGDPVPWIKK